MKDIQLRGHCPCCGNQQAVVRGRMSKHGYQVKHGWFTGICIGQHYEPIEKNRQPADQIVADVRAEVSALLARAAGLTRGTIDPVTVKSGRKLETVNNRQRWVDVELPYAEGSFYEQERAVEAEVRGLEYRAREGTAFANYLESVVKAYHGQPLLEIPKPAPAALIEPGDKKVLENGVVLTARYQDGARVYYVDTRGFKGWIGTQAWRKLEAA